MNAVTTFFKVFGFLVIIPVIIFLFPIAIAVYITRNSNDIFDLEPIAAFGSLIFISIINTAWVIILLRIIDFWISG